MSDIFRLYPGFMWYGVELTVEKAELFKQYLRDHNIQFEPSESYDNLVYLTCYMPKEELDKADEFLKGLV